MEANELIERYAHEVGQNLPRKMRQDIELELKSLLQDALEERAAVAGTEPTPQMAADILREFGKPEEMAANYRPEQYLIGPQLFPVFRLVLSIVLTIVSIGFGIGLAVILFRAEGNIGGRLWEWFAAYWQSVVFNAGLITILFAIMERAYAGKSNFESEETAVWDPLKLPPVKDPDRVNRAELIFSIVFTILAIVLFNFFPEWIGVVSITDEGVFPVAILSHEFRVHIPWLTALWSLEAVLKLFVLRDGRWQRPTRWAEFALSLFGLYVGYRIMTGGEIFTISILTLMFRFVIGVGIFIGFLESLGQLYRLLFGRPFSPVSTIKSRLA